MEAGVLSERGLKAQKPDRVFGLTKTKVFDELTNTLKEMRHTPFTDREVLYPFLIIEAKSEKGSPGFESVEMQTAFPIRTLVRLQKDAKHVHGVDINPLLWFFANQGDEWRVYACIQDEFKTVS
jgi:hypothetical protein